MHASKDLAAKLQIKVDWITQKYHQMYLDGGFNETLEKATEFLQKQYPEYKKEIAAASTDAIHTSTLEGVDDSAQLLTELLDIVRKANLMELILKR
jgi:hypothetical protein